MGLGVAIMVGGASDDALSAAQAVEVHERVGEPTTYRLRYALVAHDGDVPLLSDGRIDASAELAVVRVVDKSNVYLVKGPVTGHRVHIEHGMIDAWMEVVGADSTIAMDREAKTKVWSDVTASDVVQTIAGTYGMKVDPETTPSRSIEDKHTLVQRDTDLRFVRRLARRFGFHFWATVDSKGKTTAHFKRPSVKGDAATSLQINLDQSNVAMLDLRADFERPTSAVGAQLDLGDKTTIDGAVTKSPLALLGDRTLLDITGDKRTVRLVAPVDDADDLKGRGEGALIEAGWFVRVSCSTSIRALGSLVRPDTLVDLQGLGKRHSGKYWVHGVRHLVDASAHLMELELYRNAWGS